MTAVVTPAECPPVEIGTVMADRQVNHIVEVKPEACVQCGAPLAGKDGELARWHQVTELSRIVPVVNGYRRHTLTCGARHGGPGRKRCPWWFRPAHVGDQGLFGGTKGYQPTGRGRSAGRPLPS